MLERRRVVDVADITFAKVHPAGETDRKKTRTGRVLGRLAHAQISDLRKGSDKVRKPQLGDGVLLTFCATSFPWGKRLATIAEKG